MIAWKKKEEFKARQLELRKETLLLPLRQGSSRSTPLGKRRERNHKVSTLMFQRWNAIIVIRLGTLLRIGGSPRGSLKEDSKPLLQKKKKNPGRKRIPRLPKKRNLEENIT